MPNTGTTTTTTTTSRTTTTRYDKKLQIDVLSRAVTTASNDHAIELYAKLMKLEPDNTDWSNGLARVKKKKKNRG